MINNRKRLSTSYKISFLVLLATISVVVVYTIVSPAYKLQSPQGPAQIRFFPLEVSQVRKGISSALIEGTTELNGKKTKVSIRYWGSENIAQDDIVLISSKATQISPENTNIQTRVFLKGISYSGVAFENNLEIIKKGKAGLTHLIRKKIDKITKAIFQAEESHALVESLTMGVRNEIKTSTFLNFKNSGISHILAISGLHISIIIFLPLLILQNIMSKRKSLLLTSIIVMSYIHITGYPISLQRCALMYFLLLAEIFLNKERNSLNLLCLAGTIILIIHPEDLFTLSFQLSMGATAGIILFYTKFLEMMPLKNKYIKASISLTLSAQLFALPLIWFHFNEITTAGIVSNIIIIPMITAILSLAVISLALYSIVTPISFLTGQVTQFLIEQMNSMVTTIANFKLTFYTDNPIYPILIITMTCLLLLGSKKKLKQGTILLFLLFSPMLFAHTGNKTNSPNNTHKICIKNNILYIDSRTKLTRDDLVETLRSLQEPIKTISVDCSDIRNIKKTKFIIKKHGIKNLIIKNFQDSLALKELIYISDRDKITVSIK